MKEKQEKTINPSKIGRRAFIGLSSRQMRCKYDASFKISRLPEIPTIVKGYL
jgi:hypothetical protein